MDFDTYQQYLKDWTQHRLTQLRVDVPDDIAEAILDSLYQVYANFALKYKLYRIRLVHEKFIYDRDTHRHGFHAIFDIMDPKGVSERIGKSNTGTGLTPLGKSNTGTDLAPIGKSNTGTGLTPLGKSNTGTGLTRLGIMAYVGNHAQQILNRYREQFRIMAQYIFGSAIKMSLKIRSDVNAKTNAKFIMMIRIDPE